MNEGGKMEVRNVNYDSYKLNTQVIISVIKESLKMRSVLEVEADTLSKLISEQPKTVRQHFQFY